MQNAMTALEGARFVDVDLASEEVRQNFRVYLSEWAKSPPFYVLQNGSPQAVVSRFNDMKEVLTDRARFSSVPPPERNPRLRKFMPNKFMRVTPPTQMEGPPHARIRRLANPAFSDSAIDRLEPQVRRVIEEMVAGLRATGPVFDAMDEFGSQLMPNVMLQGLFGFTAAERDIFVKMNQSLRLTARLSPEDPFPDEYVRAFADAETVIMKIIAERRAQPGNDIISHLVLSYDDGDSLSDTELFDLIFTFGAGAIESTAATMGGALLTLCQHPDQFDRIKRDPALIPTALEECMRYHGPGFLLFTRYAMVDTDLAGTPMPAGMPIYVVNQAASWDPTQYPDPQRFDIDRNPQRVPVFGGGVHFCIGNRLARMVLRTGLETLVAAFPRLRLADPDFHPVYGGALSETQLTHLPLRWD
ncbi:MAG: hypothetical protein JWR77_1122 [Rhizorhabdus sp.]|nr:hypothetical protein [Rhizorhabdus sp.]